MILVDTSVWIDFFNGVKSEERDQLRNLIIYKEYVMINNINQ
jgi:predicted nucleic acid-binding protein